MLHADDQSQFVAAAGPVISQDLSVSDRRVRRLATSVLLHGADDATEAPGQRMEARRITDRQRRAAFRLRSQHGDGMWTRSRRDGGILDVFYPGTSATLSEPTGIAASRQ